MSESKHSPLALALGRIPCGLYIVTIQDPGGKAVGFVGSFVMQQGFEPPTVSVAIAKGRDHLEYLRASGKFTLSLLDKDSSGLMGTFFRKLPEGESPYDTLGIETTPSGGTILTDALAWMDCELVGEYETGDHVICFGKVIDGSMQREGDPQLHLRTNGLGY